MKKQKDERTLKIREKEEAKEKKQFKFRINFIPLTS